AVFGRMSISGYLTCADTTTCLGTYPLGYNFNPRATLVGVWVPTEWTWKEMLIFVPALISRPAPSANTSAPLPIAYSLRNTPCSSLGGPSGPSTSPVWRDSSVGATSDVRMWWMTANPLVGMIWTPLM